MFARTFRSMALAVVVWIAAGSAGGAQAPAGGRTVWDGVYTEAQAARGTAVFSASCANCHSFDAQGNRPLSGEAFWNRQVQKSLVDLHTYVRTSMPNGVNAGTLPLSSYNDVMALILKSNGVPPGATELSPESIAGVQIVPKDGAVVELPAGTLVRVVGCLTRVGSDWVLTSATAPERVQKGGVGEEDATRPLGTGNTPLKFLVTRLDAFAGQRMSASGLLIGPGGKDGLNVTTVNRVAETCP